MSCRHAYRWCQKLVSKEVSIRLNFWWMDTSTCFLYIESVINEFEQLLSYPSLLFTLLFHFLIILSIFCRNFKWINPEFSSSILYHSLHKNLSAYQSYRYICNQRNLSGVIKGMIVSLEIDRVYLCPVNQVVLPRDLRIWRVYLVALESRDCNLDY